MLAKKTMYFCFISISVVDAILSIACFVLSFLKTFTGRDVRILHGIELANLLLLFLLLFFVKIKWKARYLGNYETGVAAPAWMIALYLLKAICAFLLFGLASKLNTQLQHSALLEVFSYVWYHFWIFHLTPLVGKTKEVNNE